MLDVYICEDEKEQLDLFSGYVSNTILIEDLDMRLALSTQDYHELLELFPPSGNTAVFFLDIDLKSDIDGLMLAQRIRQLQPRCFIVFITSHGECGMETRKKSRKESRAVCWMSRKKSATTQKFSTTKSGNAMLPYHLTKSCVSRQRVTRTKSRYTP